MNPETQNQGTEKSFGAIAGIIVILAVLVAGGVCFANQIMQVRNAEKLEDQVTVNAPGVEDVTTTTSEQSGTTQSTTTIEEDINIDPSEFNLDLSDIEAELQ